MRKGLSEIQKGCERIHFDIYELKNMINTANNYICGTRNELEKLRQDLFKDEKETYTIYEKDSKRSFVFSSYSSLRASIKEMTFKYEQATGECECRILLHLGDNVEDKEIMLDNKEFNKLFDFFKKTLLEEN